jgi:hypothetical protein
LNQRARVSPQGANRDEKGNMGVGVRGGAEEAASATALGAGRRAPAALAAPLLVQQRRHRRRRGGHGIISSSSSSSSSSSRRQQQQHPLVAATALALLALLPATATAATPPPTTTPSSFLRIFYPTAAADQFPPKTAPLLNPQDPNRDGGRTRPHSTGLAPSASVTALYCPNGGALEGGLCYPRCRLGWRGAGCTCWKDGLTYARGCGQRPAVCDATSFRRNPLPPIVDAAAVAGGGDGDGFSSSSPEGDFTNAIAAGGAASPGTTTTTTNTNIGPTTTITLVLSTDPQLFRNGSSPDARASAVNNNRLLAQSINRVRELGQWPQAAGGGGVAEPRALVVLGDLTEAYREREADAFRHYYDPSFPGNAGERVRFPTWLMLGNHDYVNNAMGAVSAKELEAGRAAGGGGGGSSASSSSSAASSSSSSGGGGVDVEAPLSADYEALEPEASANNKNKNKNNNNSNKPPPNRRGNDDAPCSDKAAIAGDGSACAKRVVDEMRALLSPQCPTRHWSSFPKGNVTSFDADSMAYAFDYGRYHFVALHFSPRHRSARLSVAGSLAWLSRELSHAAAQGRRVVILVHSHGELGLADDPTFSRLIGGGGSPVVALFFGHIHVRPWGYAGTFPRTAVPMFNCGASWYNTYCVAEFAEEGMRVGAVSHDGDGKPRWFGHAAHLLPAPGAPLGGDGSGGGGGGGGGAAAAAAARTTGIAAPPAKPALLAYEPNPKGSPWLRNRAAS